MNKEEIKITSKSLYDAAYNYCFFSALKESEEDIKTGRIYDLNEVKKERKRFYESYSNQS